MPGDKIVTEEGKTFTHRAPDNWGDKKEAATIREKLAVAKVRGPFPVPICAPHPHPTRIAGEASAGRAVRGLGAGGGGRGGLGGGLGGADAEEGGGEAASGPAREPPLHHPTALLRIGNDWGPIPGQNAGGDGRGDGEE